jgi:ABC-type uncharacterized transport system substrate-binding protein
MRRREFIRLLSSTLAAWPLAARAQQGDGARRIGVLMSVSESDPEAQVWSRAFTEGLQQLGWTAGHNIRLDYRWAPPVDAQSRQRVAKELVALQPDLILAQNTVSTASLYRRAATYADRILRGTKPSELPVQLPVKVQLTLNLKAAKALGLDVPPSVRLRADEVIE